MFSIFFTLPVVNPVKLELTFTCKVSIPAPPSKVSAGFSVLSEVKVETEPLNKSSLSLPVNVSVPVVKLPVPLI
ncbi:hypothetical protein NG754_10710 [Aliarcobacter cryaerophilus]|uniref:hypothetical protein n=1 Tax=Aliarcobacter cryaerophilus TaxID=28198 RepID=UPI003DA3C429